MKSVTYHVKYIDLHSVLQRINLKAINRLILAPLFCRDFSNYLIRKACYRSENRAMLWQTTMRTEI